MPRKLSKIALALALLGASVLAGATGFVAYRRSHLPLVSFKLERSSPLSRGYAHFIDGDRALVVYDLDTRDDDVSEVWSLETGRLVRVEPRKGIRPFMFAKSDRFLVRRVDHEPTLTLADGASGNSIREIRGEQGIDGLSFARNRDLVAVSSFGGVAVHSTRDGSLVRAIEAPALERGPTGSRESECALSPSGKAVAVNTRKGSVWVASVEDGSIATVFSGAYVYEFPTEDEVLTCDNEIAMGWSLLVRSAHDGQTLRSHRSPVVDDWNFDVASSAFAVRAPGNAIEVRSLDTFEVLRRFDLADKAYFSLSPEGDKLAVIHADGRVDVWSVP